MPDCVTRRSRAFFVARPAARSFVQPCLKKPSLMEERLSWRWIARATIRRVIRQRTNHRMLVQGRATIPARRQRVFEQLTERPQTKGSREKGPTSQAFSSAS